MKVAHGEAQPQSNSRSYPAGYCILHPDVRVVKAGGWHAWHEKCHKCLHLQNTPYTESLTSDSRQEESSRRHEKQNQSDAHRRSSSRGRHRETNHRDENKCRPRSRSKSIGPRSKSLCRKVQQFTPNRTVCVDGVPFDKSGRCFVHKHVKLASKKLLGGWKVHFQFCPECAKHNGNEENCSVISGFSGHSLGSFASGFGDHSVASSTNHSRGDASVRSTRFYKSITSQRSWSSKQSRTRMNKTDVSFLPLDEDGYCLRHPDVQLAESKKGAWNVLLDFCPECVEETLIIGRPLPMPRRPSHYSSRSSVSSSGTFVEDMPYIDGEGQPGHYSGHVDGEGKPTGRGKMRYKNGVWDGVWEEGTKIHGVSKLKTTSSPRHESKSKHRHSLRDEPRHAAKRRIPGSSRSRPRNKCE